MYKPRDGVNIIRILPPTWKDARHYGYDLWVHWGVGADRQTYLDLKRMKGEPDPVEEEVANLHRAGEEKLAKEAASKKRVGIYLIDRKEESAGVQFWAMPHGTDTEIVQLSVNERTNASLCIDDPDEGFDVTFSKKGQMKNTEYYALKIDRDSSPLGNPKWLDWAVENPIPDQLIFYSYDHIASMLGGGGSHTQRRDRDEDDDRPSSRREESRNRDDDRSPRRDRDEEPPRRRSEPSDDDRPPSRSRDDSRSEGNRRRSVEPDSPTWDSIHGSTRREMEDLIETERLDIKPREAKDDEDLADWICDEMKLKKPEPRARRDSRDEAPAEEDDRAAKLRRMREDRDR